MVSLSFTELWPKQPVPRAAATVYCRRDPALRQSTLRALHSDGDLRRLRWIDADEFAIDHRAIAAVTANLELIVHTFDFLSYQASGLTGGRTFLDMHKRHAKLSLPQMYVESQMSATTSIRIDQSL